MEEEFHKKIPIHNIGRAQHVTAKDETEALKV